MDSLVRLFRRETVSTEFIPAIDGLRFLAILMVVLFHVNAYVLEKSAGLWVAPASFNSGANILFFGHQGVQLFFVISGFILAMPFMRWRLGLSDKCISLRQYYFRRLTRLEPPYIVCTVILFLALAFIVNEKYSLGDLVASLVASLFYINNVLFPGEFPRINPVTWSLEIEIQFYLIAPFVIWILCLVKDKLSRRLIVLGCITAFSFLSWMLETVWQVRVISLGGAFQYFLAGILLCDLYLLDQENLHRLNRTWFSLIGAFLLVMLVAFEHSLTPNLFLKIASPLMIFAFYLLVLSNRLWNQIFSLTGLTLIGGMCYTIYLWHYAIISAVGRITVSRIVSANFYTYFATQTIIYLIAILIFASILFLLIEKPCMKRDWYLKFVKNLRSAFQRRPDREIEDPINVK